MRLSVYNDGVERASALYPALLHAQEEWCMRSRIAQPDIRLRSRVDSSVPELCLRSGVKCAIPPKAMRRQHDVCVPSWPADFMNRLLFR